MFATDACGQYNTRKDDVRGELTFRLRHSQEHMRHLWRRVQPTPDKWKGKIPGFDADAASVVRLAVDHLRDRGYTQFGFCGFGGANYSERRLSELRKHVRSLGHNVVAYESPGPTSATTFGAEQSGMLDQKGLAR